MKLVLGAIITYNPDISLLKVNIENIINQVDEVIIVDNNSQNIDNIESAANKYGLAIIKNPLNYGVAKALNQILNYALENNFEYILTLDQDSIVMNEFVSAQMEVFKTNADCALVGSRIIDLNLLEYEVISSNSKCEEVKYVITSGSLGKVSALMDVGMFDEELFIDYVDFEMCLRLRTRGYKIYKANNAVLFHKLGESRKLKIFGKEIVITNHKPERRYYYFRNRIYVFKKYLSIFPLMSIKGLLGVPWRAILILIFERNKAMNLKNIVKGIIHGMFVRHSGAKKSNYEKINRVC